LIKPFAGLGLLVGRSVRGGVGRGTDQVGEGSEGASEGGGNGHGVVSGR